MLEDANQLKFLKIDFNHLTLDNLNFIVVE